jgi:fibrillarin-like pre-rRNA processing protein
LIPPKIRPHPKFTNVFMSGSSQNLKLYTINLVRGKSVYEEQLILHGNEEFRAWDPFRSKLCALIHKKVQNIYFERETTCLYLGAATGTTISHISDILTNGLIFGVEISERSIRNLIQNMETRKNVVPILGNALNPEEYSKYIYKLVDIIYQDVSHPEQARIAINNANFYLKENGKIILFIKSQSIDSTIKPKKVFNKEIKRLTEANFKVLEKIDIDSYATGHLGVILEK